MERKPIEFETTLGKHKVLMVPWLTGGDKRKLNKIADSEDQKAMAEKIQDLMIETLIVSIDGEKEKEKIESALDNMHGKDFDEIMQKMTQVVNDSSLPEQKKSN